MTAPAPVPDGTTPPTERMGIGFYVDALNVSKAAMDRVRAIHSPVDAVNYHGGTPRQTRVCAGCGTDDGNWQIWPCPTIRALEGDKR